MATEYERIPVPGIHKGNDTKPEELLYSTIGYRQYGVTIAGGQGIIRAGTVLGQRTSNKKYYVYNNGAGDGTQTARCVLRRTVDTGGAGAEDQLGNILVSGMLKLGMISGADAAALTDLGAVTDTVRGTFKF